ncbi:asparagine synthase-related protein [Nonomuraea sp. NPDC050790]|uniref:asparagine synthase-related protein n=1 Tax=Nonomuraea sp. NPDC050790 TaxID=3364371 RepID=UPI0037A55DCA
MSAPWFVVLPDLDGSAQVHENLAQLGAVQEVPHPSGRPWLVGRWWPAQFAVVRSADAAVAVIGEHAMTPQSLRPGLRDVGGLAARLTGSAHLIASARGEVRVQGTASGLRRVYWCVVNGLPVAGDRANVLAALTGTGPDPVKLATRLLFPSVTWPLSWAPVWSGVEAVLPGHCLTLAPGRTPAQRRWWHPPDPAPSRAEGVAAFRNALIQAVELRARPGRTVVSHLSGMDSSSVCSLAARAGAEVVALTAAQPDPMDDDVLWARRTHAALTARGDRVIHEIITAEECPLVYQDMLTGHDDFDEPFQLQHNRSRLLCVNRRGQAYAPDVHLTGVGGDELSLMLPTWLPTLLRRHPLTGLRQLRAMAAKYRWPARQVIRTLAAGRDHAAWLRATAAGLGTDGRGTKTPVLGWDSHPTMPQWATPEALDMVVAELRAAAERRTALAPSRGPHHNLVAVHAGSQAMSGFQQLAAQEGIVLSAPFLDDRVIEASLSVPAEGRHDPARYKPMLVDAMRGLVPAVTLTRTTKAETSASAVMGSRRHRDQIVGLAQDSLLAGLGLIDADAFLAACRGPIDVLTQHQRIEPTLACERWLRSVKEDAHVRLGA